MTDLPARPPEADLLRRARRRLRLSIREAAERASQSMPPGSGGRGGISEGRLRQIEAGYQTVSKGIQVPTSATDVTLAYLARFYGITPEELETEGQRPDAAGELREILHAEPAAPHVRPVPPIDATQYGDDDTESAAATELVRLLAEHPDDRILAMISVRGGAKATTRLAEARGWLGVQEDLRNGTDG